MTPVTNTKDLGDSVMYFTGKTLADSIKAAEAWGKTNGVIMNRYYPQKFDGRSILASYSRG